MRDISEHIPILSKPDDATIALYRAMAMTLWLPQAEAALAQVA